MLGRYGLYSQPQVGCVTLGTSQSLGFPICQIAYSGDLLECPGLYSWKVLTLHVFIRVFSGIQPAWNSQLPLCTHTDPIAWPCTLASVRSPPLHLGLFPFRICWSPSVGSQEGLPRITWHTLRNEGSRTLQRYPGGPALTFWVVVPAQG